jgi:2,3-dihydroxyphenylpropionate 1,2-dioxygenase
MQRCAAMGREIARILEGRNERVAVIASGGMSHYPGTSKYEYPEFNFDYWMISQMEIGNVDAILNLTPEQLDETGNTEMLNWATMLGMIGSVPGELIQYTPTWHHGHGYMQFIPQRERKTPTTQIQEEYGGFKFKNKGFEFYKHPPAAAAKLNRLLFDIRLSTKLCERVVENLESVCTEYGFSADQQTVAQGLIDVGTTNKVSEYVPPFVEAGVHPLLALMALHAIYPHSKKALQTKN